MKNSLQAVNRFLEEHMKKAGIKMSFALGGTSSAICALQDKGLVDYILDTQDFDQGAAAHLFSNPHHIEIDLSEYANAGNKGAYVNKLDYVVLSALEIDTKFNVNVITGSDGLVFRRRARIWSISPRRRRAAMAVARAKARSWGGRAATSR